VPRRDVLILAVTGYGGDDDRRRSQEAGCDDHLIKPVNPEDLYERIARRRKSPP
jgi:two-component system CheB/CheR fusion protein